MIFKLLVVAVIIRVAEGIARSAVLAGDVADAPTNLGDGVTAPVATFRCHLITRQSLRNTIRPGRGVVSIGFPVAFPGPQRIQAVPLRLIATTV